ncbi:uncharacterized protein LACBIDRAFT_316238 [Laccaria bicolor S238N-H82]|nr:uncharacterized protein LACBIDRAFT_316238 [Laccaria bicolor S238N-H82]EDQ99623.1 predicted protein [Laccaria bicolor S238N-H82]|eukprot:XP_001889734.1 predicted protein [Laccaria bicolor S238N-H82]
MKEHTTFYPPNSDLGDWAGVTPSTTTAVTQILLAECSTLEGTRNLYESLLLDPSENKRIGVLNFASAKNAGGGFIRGAQAQEESIARSSSLYPSLINEEGAKFYRIHNKDPREGYYSHAMIYSPRVVFFRDDLGNWKSPIEVDIVTSPAVNAGVVRRYLREIGSADESKLDAAMKERMARILYLFEKQGMRNLVLGSFGTGVFRNRVELVASIWTELLIGEGARFKHSFDHVIFAILGHQTFKTFETIFGEASAVKVDAVIG